jgi:TPR repeat protein
MLRSDSYGKHLLEAAERGDAEAQFNLGIIYENGLNDSRYVVEGNPAEAVRWLLAAAEQGLPRAQIKLAELYAGETDISESSVKACGWYLLAMPSLRGAPSPKGSVRLSARLLRLGAVSNRRGQAFCAGLEAKGGDYRGSVRSAGDA